MNPDLVEAVARAIEGMPGEKSRWIAEAALKAQEKWLASQGLVVVPREADYAMLEAVVDPTADIYLSGKSVKLLWRTMIEAHEDAKQPLETPHSPAESEMGPETRNRP